MMPWVEKASAGALPVLFFASLALAGAPAPRPDTGRPAYATASGRVAWQFPVRERRDDR